MHRLHEAKRRTYHDDDLELMGFCWVQAKYTELVEVQWSVNRLRSEKKEGFITKIILISAPKRHLISNLEHIRIVNNSFKYPVFQVYDLNYPILKLVAKYPILVPSGSADAVAS